MTTFIKKTSFFHSTRVFSEHFIIPRWMPDSEQIFWWGFHNTNRSDHNCFFSLSSSYDFREIDVLICINYGEQLWIILLDMVVNEDVWYCSSALGYIWADTHYEVYIKICKPLREHQPVFSHAFCHDLISINSHVSLNNDLPFKQLKTNSKNRLS